MLTEVQVGRGSRAGVAVDGDRWRRTGRARERTVAGRLRVCRCVEEVRAGAAKGSGVQGDPNVTGGEKF